MENFAAAATSSPSTTPFSTCNGDNATKDLPPAFRSRKSQLSQPERKSVANICLTIRDDINSPVVRMSRVEFFVMLAAHSVALELTTNQKKEWLFRSGQCQHLRGFPVSCPDTRCI